MFLSKQETPWLFNVGSKVSNEKKQKQKKNKKKTTQQQQQQQKPEDCKNLVSEAFSFLASKCN